MTAPKPKTLPFSADDLISRALSFVGTKESPAGSNRQRFGARYEAKKHGHNGVAWCGQFVWAVFESLGADLIADGYGISNCQYTPYFAAGARKAGWTRVDPTKIRKGDVLFFDFPDRTKRIQHVGLATASPSKGYVATVEGNTSSGKKGSQDNGDGVYRRSRLLGHIREVWRPAYGSRPQYKPTSKAVAGVVLVLATGALVYNGKTYTTGPAPRVTVTKTVTARPTATAKPQAPAPRPTVKVVPKPPAPPARPKPVFVKVRRGDSLTAIGKRNHTDWKTLARLNKLRSPYTIRPGQQLRVR